MSYLYRSLGEQIKENLMAGQPTKTKSAGDYTGLVIPPCGEFAKTTSSAPPWTRQTSLHEEIVNFVRYMSPTASEVALREGLVKRFSDLIASFKMGVTVRPVGSYVTGLYLPTSDIDMVLTAEHAYAYSSTFQARLDLTKISRKLQVSKFASKIDEVFGASVPLLRITDNVTGIQIDLTAADAHGMKATGAVQKWLKHDTGLIKALVLVLKTFLSIRKCGTTYTGGINSYVLVWMVVAWVKLEWKKPSSSASSNISSLDAALASLSLDPKHGRAKETALSATSSAQVEDYGEALKGFLKFYGSEYDYYGKAIRIEPSPSYVTKTHPYSRYATTQRYLLSIFDPADSSIDMGAKAYAIKHIQVTFMSAYRTTLLKDPLHKPSVQSYGLLDKVLGGDFLEFVAKRKRMSLH